jgi:hypothetical protein
LYLLAGAAPFNNSAILNLAVSFDLGDPRVALVDLNLDGQIDILRHDDADG